MPAGDMTVFAETTLGPEAFHAGLLVTAFAFGLRHGADWDHIAAISDIAGAGTDRRRSMTLSLVYAIGHALVVLVLGLAAIFFGGFIPDSVDSIMSKIVGATLIALGVYLVFSLALKGRDFRFQSRWSLVIGWAQRLRQRKGELETFEVEHEHPHEHGIPGGHDHDHEELGPARTVAVATRTQAHSHRHTHRGTVPVGTYGVRTTFAIGVLHGIGAETPSQLVIFLTAAGVGGHIAGAGLLLAFIAGLLVTNTFIAGIASAGFLNAERHFVLYASLGAATAIFSLILGAMLLLDRAGRLPSLFG